MEKTLHTTPQHWQNPKWYHALSLTERIASLRACTHDASSLTAQQTARATRRLQAWKTQRPFDHGTLFADRLDMAGSTEDDLTFLLAEPIDAVQSRTACTPDWLATLVEAFEHYDIGEVLFEEMTSLAPYLQPLLPLIRHGLAQLRAGIQMLCQQYASLPFDAQHISQAFFPSLAERLLSQVNKIFVLEMHVARVQDRLRGETTQERFADFVRQLSQEGKILPLLEEYPVLARQLVLTIDQWVQYTQEFLAHLCADWQEIRSTFTPEHDPGLLVEVRGGVGDRHRNGRSVLILRFSSGFQVLYKPKSLAIDVHFQELLAWLNEQGAQPAFRTVGIIDRGSYGWAEFVHAYGCTSAEEIARFYERQGSYLALLYALNAVDMHLENLIAAGEHPILIDLESLFHTRVGGDNATEPSQLAHTTMDRTVFRVGLLPNRMWSTKDSVGLDLSGLGGQPGQMNPRPYPTWEAAGTDQMRLVREHKEIAVKQNRPKLNGQGVNVLDYNKHIVAGFKSMYQLLQQRRAELMADILPRFAHDEVRVIVRPTHRYAHLLMECVHPDLLHDALDRDRFFDNLWRDIEFQPHLSRLIAAEQRSLLLGDTPMFLTYPDSRAVFASDGEWLGDLFAEPSLELVKKQLLHMNEQDLARQTWVVEAALATSLIGPEHTTGKPFRLKPPQSFASRTRLIASAAAVGTRLDRLAARTEDVADWLGLSTAGGTAWSLQLADTSLYNGTSGIALFLSYLGAVTHEVCYTALARLALASVRLQVEQQKQYLPMVSIVGGFTGLGSFIYLLTHLSVLWQDPTLLQEAETLVELLPDLIAKDEHLDIMGGSAGCILNLLSLYSVQPSVRTLDVALQCGDRLLTTAKPMPDGVAWTTTNSDTPLGGFSHGSAGIAFSLFKLAEISGQERYLHTALAALAYDRSLFLPERQNWADLRDLSLLLGAETQEPHSMVAWCHGAPGIGLSRLGILRYMDNATIREEIAIALRTTLAVGVNGGNHSLCHGMLGNVELLLMATHLLDDPSYSEALERVTAMIVDSIDEHGWVPGVPLGVETPGLMVGLAGIGYELLRLAAPQQVPSVLLLAPPSYGRTKKFRAARQFRPSLHHIPLIHMS